MKSDSSRSADTARGGIPRSFSRLRFTSKTFACVLTSGTWAIARPQLQSTKLRTINIRIIRVGTVFQVSTVETMVPPNTYKILLSFAYGAYWILGQSEDGVADFHQGAIRI